MGLDCLGRPLTSPKPCPHRSCLLLPHISAPSPPSRPSLHNTMSCGPCQVELIEWPARLDDDTPAWHALLKSSGCDHLVFAGGFATATHPDVYRADGTAVP